MKKGDLKAHVLLLANIFLGLNADAYVCIGYARRPPERAKILKISPAVKEKVWRFENVY